jgi:hypothetical protein
MGVNLSEISHVLKTSSTTNLGLNLNQKGSCNIYTTTTNGQLSYWGGIVNRWNNCNWGWIRYIKKGANVGVE